MPIEKIKNILEELGWPMLYETGGGHEFISPNIFEFMGYYSEEVMHNRDFFPGRIHPEDYPELNHLVREWHKEGEPEFLLHAFRIKMAWGEYQWLEDYIQEVKENTPKKYMRGVMILIDDEKKEEIKLLKQKFMLQKNNDADEKVLNEINAKLHLLKLNFQRRNELVDQLFREITLNNVLFEEMYRHYPGKKA